MARDPEYAKHQEWLGFIQPVGLVVSPPALCAAQAHIDSAGAVQRQQQFRELVSPPGAPGDGGATRPAIRDLPAFLCKFLGWQPTDLHGAPGQPPYPGGFDVFLPELGLMLSPDFAVPDEANPGSYALLLKEAPEGHDLDAELAEGNRTWGVSQQARFERLLRETGVPAGLLSNGTQLRLVYAPSGETSGHLTWDVAKLCEVAGRPMLGALSMLLGADRMFTLPSQQRLGAILRESRKYQSQVSTALAEQVLEALHELLRGFQAADEATQGQLLGELLAQSPRDIYGGLLTTLMRLVFVLYAEDRGLMPQDPVYANHYSVTGLFERLRSDAGRYPDTMDQRYGAWAQLLTLFRLLYDGAAHGGLRLPRRHGRLFDPQAYPFLEGRVGERGTGNREQKTINGTVNQPIPNSLLPVPCSPVPRVPDGTVCRVLEKLLVLDGDRLSYRALDVEQIGSVYEAMMGFELCRARGPSVAVRPDHVVVDLTELLEVSGSNRAKLLKERANCEMKGKAAEELKAARTVEELTGALGRRLSPRTPRPVAPGGMYLQPTQERRRSGSHYTPRSLTEPIVRKTLEPIFERLGEKPRAEAILALKVCDPAMGSGAFLVEACRQLGEKLVAAWQAHDEMPVVPADEDPQLYARRIVAQRCLYGVDKNPFAVDLAKLSLWLATLAKDHPFTFLDHALKRGDSLVGLTRRQIASFHWEAKAETPLVSVAIEKAVRQASEARRRIAELSTWSDDTATEDWKERLLAESAQAMKRVKFIGDTCIAAFFGAEKPKDREKLRGEHQKALWRWMEGGGQGTLFEESGLAPVRQAVQELRAGPDGVTPFHWEVEFPEVFEGEEGGFDAIVGNPPFAGKNTITEGNREGYLPWLQTVHEASHGNADLVAHFYRLAFDRLGPGGCFGLIATNTIAQGDTRSTGLKWICTHGGTIYAARRRVKWPGKAAVVVSVVNIAKGEPKPPFELDGKAVERITAFLFHGGGHGDPAPLAENSGKSFIGSYVLGMGFTFDDTNEEATPIAEMHRLIDRDPRNGERTFPYIGGEEVNDSPTHAHRRYVINFGEMTEEEARRWPDLMEIVEREIRGRRGSHSTAGWWQFERLRPELYSAIAGLPRVLVIPRVTQNAGFTFLPTGMVYSEQLVVFALSSYAPFCALQSRPHELWARFFGSSMKDDLRYTPSDCFETFPFPPNWKDNPTLEAAGREYYEFRAALMVRNDQGLTATYNRFHDPDERDPEIRRLRELHAAMDRAVLDAYGWTDLAPTCQFLLDYEEPDEEAEDTGEAPTRRRKKKPWRYRWPDDLRDEVLARLLVLNEQRAREEQLSGAAAEKPHRRGRGNERTS